MLVGSGSERMEGQVTLEKESLTIVNGRGPKEKSA